MESKEINRELLRELYQLEQETGIPITEMLKTRLSKRLDEIKEEKQELEQEHLELRQSIRKKKIMIFIKQIELFYKRLISNVNQTLALFKHWLNTV